MLSSRSRSANPTITPRSCSATCAASCLLFVRYACPEWLRIPSKVSPPARAGGELPPAQLHTFVGLGVRPQRHAQARRPLRHLLHVPLDHIKVQQERGRLQIVHLPAPFSLSICGASDGHIGCGRRCGWATRCVTSTAHSSSPPHV